MNNQQPEADRQEFDAGSIVDQLIDGVPFELTAEQLAQLNAGNPVRVGTYLLQPPAAPAES